MARACAAISRIARTSTPLPMAGQEMTNASTTQSEPSLASASTTLGPRSPRRSRTRPSRSTRSPPAAAASTSAGVIGTPRVNSLEATSMSFTLASSAPRGGRKSVSTPSPAMKEASDRAPAGCSGAPPSGPPS